MSMLAYTHQSGLMDLLQSLNSELLGAVMIIGTVGFFLTVIITVVTITNAITNVRVMKLHHSTVKDLLNQGYSADDIERVTLGKNGLGNQFKKLVRAATNRISNYDRNSPAPPVKQNAC